MSTQAAKLLSMILAGACGVFVLLAIAMQFGFGRGYTWLQPDVDSTGIASVAIDRTAFKLPPETQFADTTARPLFNDDRKPTPEAPDSPDTPPPPQVPLNIALTGIILTPQVNLAMVHDKLKNRDLALKEGMPMEGDQGGWTLTKINPRSAIFRETSGEEVEVELSTAVASPNPVAHAPGGPAPQRPPGQVAPPPAQPVAGPAQNEQSQALQRRIEERRAQMREEAERLRREKAESKQQ